MDKINDIPYRIRIPNNTLLEHHTTKRKLKAYRFFSLRCGERKGLNYPRKLWGNTAYISCYRSAKEHIIVISNEKGCDSLLDYMRRWEIECLFQALKGRGFDLESTHLQDRRRIERSIGILALAYCWAISVGEWRAEEKPIKILKHGRPSHTLFRYGHEFLAYLMFSCAQSFEKLLFHIQHIGKGYNNSVNAGAG